MGCGVERSRSDNRGTRTVPRSGYRRGKCTSHTPLKMLPIVSPTLPKNEQMFSPNPLINSQMPNGAERRGNLVGFELNLEYYGRNQESSELGCGRREEIVPSTVRSALSSTSGDTVISVGAFIFFPLTLKKSISHPLTMTGRSEGLTYQPYYDWSKGKIMWKSVSVSFTER